MYSNMFPSLDTLETLSHAPSPNARVQKQNIISSIFFLKIEI